MTTLRRTTDALAVDYEQRGQYYYQKHTGFLGGPVADDVLRTGFAALWAIIN
jgi:hypothetical protein